MNEVVIYKSLDNETKVEVQFEGETVWLNQNQMALLFNQTKQNISLHINNCFKERELNKKATVKESLTVQKEGNRQVKRKLEYYNLDVIISVGYRVKSVRGTQFRQWATQKLKEYLVQGYIINKKRLEEREFELKYLKSGISIINRTIENQAGNLNEAKKISSLLEDFSSGLSLLDDYDNKKLDTKGKSTNRTVIVESHEYKKLIKMMKREFDSKLFGKEKDSSFESSVSQIYQIFDGKELYPSIEEKGAMLLYLIVKNHSFIDGNKRIAAACFLYFLERNNLLYNSVGLPIISNDTLASTTLLIAESKPEEMQTVKNVIVSILNRKRK